MRIPQVFPTSKCKLRLLKLERIKDFLLLEEEFIRNQEVFRPHEVGACERTILSDTAYRPIIQSIDGQTTNRLAHPPSILLQPHARINTQNRRRTRRSGPRWRTCGGPHWRWGT